MRKMQSALRMMCHPWWLFIPAAMASALALDGMQALAPPAAAPASITMAYMPMPPAAAFLAESHAWKHREGVSED